jgi:hypothetical protein
LKYQQSGATALYNCLKAELFLNDVNKAEPTGIKRIAAAQCQ